MPLLFQTPYRPASDRRPLRGGRGAAWAAGLGLCAALVAASGASAQEADAPLVEPGRLRLEVAPLYTTWSSRFGLRTEDGRRVEEKEPLGWDLARAEVGTGMFPQLRAQEELLGALLDDPGFRLVMGATRATVTRSSVRIPVAAHVGVTRWLTVGASVPFVMRRAEVDLAFRPGSTTNVGLSPALDDPGAVEGFLSGFDVALAQLQGSVESICGTFGDGDDRCAEARGVLQDSRGFFAALSEAYGSADFFPLRDSGWGLALAQRMSSVRERMAGYDADAPASVPMAGAPLEAAGFGTFLSDPVHGVSGLPPETWQSLWSVGDVELHAAARILEAGLRRGEDGDPALRLMLGAGALVRLPTGLVEDPQSFVDFGSGDGQTDLELRMFGDLALGSRLGLRADVRRGIQREGVVDRRMSPPDVVFAPAASRARLRWDPGDYTRLDVVPRVWLSRELSLSARYRYFGKARDTYALAESGQNGGPQPPFTPAALEQETEATLHELGLGLTYSAVDAARRGRARWPFEMRAEYGGAVAGGGGQTPVERRLQVGLRLFTRLWGADGT